jgi:hypothetical protein
MHICDHHIWDDTHELMIDMIDIKWYSYVSLVVMSILTRRNTEHDVSTLDADCWRLSRRRNHLVWPTRATRYTVFRKPRFPGVV